MQSIKYNNTISLLQMTIKRLQNLLLRYEQGERTEKLFKALKTAVLYRNGSNADALEIEDMDEAYRWLKNKLEHGHFKS